MRIPSSDHVSVAVHELGGNGRPLLISHATGFHGYCYLSIADELSDSCSTFAIDHRGHGATARPDDWSVDWSRYGDDTTAVVEAIGYNRIVTIDNTGDFAKQWDFISL